MWRLLAVDDDEQFLKSLKKMLGFKDYMVDTLSNPFEAAQNLDTEEYVCILLDVKMPGMDGIELMQELRKKNRNVPIIMISGQSTIRIAVDAIKQGAYDFIEKPLDPDRLLIALKNAVDKNNWLHEKNVLISELDSENRMIGNSASMRQIFQQCQALAKSDSKVLITGATGTGKELVARALHYQSDRAGKPYIKLNCAAIPHHLLESDLFGHKKGSFTGAVEDKIGKFQAVDGGTLFLDEIGDMDIRLQAKLLRVLEEGEFEMLGSTESIKTKCRIISATNKDLNALIGEGRFRADLFHRINIVNVEVPPLDERREDIVLLARYFLNLFTSSYNKKILDFSPEAREYLTQRDWPGNVRQLRNLIERTTVFSDGPILDVTNLQKAARTNSME